jgi:photosystem II stability/assembly factor-like uncharacterized protein
MNLSMIFKKPQSRLLVLLFLVAGLTAGCLGNRQIFTVGTFKSFDKGMNWSEKNMALSSAGIGSLGGVNVLGYVFDPQDNFAIYMHTDAAGLFYTYDGGDSWFKANQVGDGRIESVAVDAKDKCNVYATYANTILKTSDCSRTWQETYIDTRPEKMVTALAVDWFEPLTVYAGNNAGDILKSIDGGVNWQVVNRLDNPITKILIDFNDSRVLYVATKTKGIFKSINGGATWDDINESLKRYSAALEYRNLVFDYSKPNTLLLVSKYGLIKTEDGGDNWEALTLITPPATTEILSVAIDPFDGNEIYYATASTFYKTTDGGQNWTTTRLPSGSAATALAIDPKQPHILYMGMTNLEQR